ncbi:MAG: CYTH domain-containing protein [Saprospiraceae bacterium]|nr:CYTH domain-containing protein [Saprospiraceae bacterium]
MGIEIERKFLLANSDWKKQAGQGIEIKQGYIDPLSENTVRIRIKGNRGYLTIKGKTINTTRQEFEYEIPLQDAIELLHLCHQPIIEKVRHEVLHQGATWEIDEFKGANMGLVIAEIELDHEDKSIELPSWIGKEVSSEVKYYNSNLIYSPFSAW